MWLGLLGLVVSPDYNLRISNRLPAGILTGEMKGKLGKLLIGECSNQFFEPLFGVLKNRRAVAGKKNVEIERQK